MGKPHNDMQTASRRVFDVLATVPDPEIPVVSIVELGILQNVSLSDDDPYVAITPTYSGCPATDVILRDVRVALDQAGFTHVAVRTQLAPAWNTDMITPTGRDKLRAYGIAPPPIGAATGAIRSHEPVACPRCNATDTHEISRFGSTPCKSLWKCGSCAEPFDRFKCH